MADRAVREPTAESRQADRFRVPAIVWAIPPLLALAGGFLYPLVLMARRAFTNELGGGFDLGRFGSILATPYYLRSLLTTLEISVSATAGCLVLGFILSLILAFVPFPGSNLLGRMVDVVLAFPSFLIAFSLIFLYGSSGSVNQLLERLFGLRTAPLEFLYAPVGAIFAEILFYTPFVMRPLLASFAQLDSAHLEVASSLGARWWRIVALVILPQTIPSLLAGGSLCLMLTFNEFGIMLFLSAKSLTTLPVLVYSYAMLQLDLPSAAVVAITNVLLSLALYFLYRGLLTRFDSAPVV